MADTPGTGHRLEPGQPGLQAARTPSWPAPFGRAVETVLAAAAPPPPDTGCARQIAGPVEQARTWFSLWDSPGPGSPAAVLQAQPAAGRPACSPGCADSRPTVIADANLLCSRSCCDWLHRLVDIVAPRFRVVTTASIADETARVIAARDRTDPTAAVLDGHKQVIAACFTVIDPPRPPAGGGAFTGRDPGDRHIHESACATDARLIVSFNRPSDFTTTAAGYTVVTPDQFLCAAATADPELFAAAADAELDRAQPAGTGVRARAAAAAARRMRAARCPQFARLVTARAHRL